MNDDQRLDGKPWTDFAELLRLEEVAPGRFAAKTPGTGGHLFGGVTLGLAARAAALTVGDDRPLHAATCQYVSAGAGGTDLVITVDRVRDGRKLSLRRVAVHATDRLLFTCDAWFAPGTSGLDWQPEAPPNDRARAAVPVVPLRALHIDPLEILSLAAKKDAEAFRIHPFWARSRHPVASDHALNLAALAFLSDLCTVSLVDVPGDKGDQFASPFSLTLSHTLWVHRPFSMDDWLRVDGRPVSIHGNRGLAHGSIHAGDGTLVASFSQESIERPDP